MKIFNISEITSLKEIYLEQIEANDIAEASIIAKNKYPHKALRVVANGNQ